MSMKNPVTPAGIEPATFRFVAQHPNHCATAVPRTKVLNRNFTLEGLYEPVEGKEQDTVEFYRNYNKECTDSFSLPFHYIPLERLTVLQQEVWRKSSTSAEKRSEVRCSDGR